MVKSSDKKSKTNEDKKAKTTNDKKAKTTNEKKTKIVNEEKKNNNNNEEVKASYSSPTKSSTSHLQNLEMQLALNVKATEELKRQFQQCREELELSKKKSNTSLIPSPQKTPRPRGGGKVSLSFAQEKEKRTIDEFVASAMATTKGAGHNTYNVSLMFSPG